MNKHYTHMPHAFTALAALAALALLGTGAQAQTYTKVGTGPDSLPANAQVTQGFGTLTTILGSLSTVSTASTASNPDLFEIYIDGTAPFSATTHSFDTTIYDTQLFLFNLDGTGVYANDDASDFARYSVITAPAPLTPGLYFLGVSSYGAIPRSGVGAAFDMFPNTFDDTSGRTPTTGLRTPTPGVTGPLTNWFVSGADVETGAYSIILSGVSYAVPEASTTVSLGLLLALGGGLALASRRRKAQAA